MADRLRELITLPFNNRILVQLEKQNGIGSLLDVGCGTGGFLKLAKKRGWEVYGCETDKTLANVCMERHGIPLHAGPVTSIENNKGPFTAIVCRYSLEHFINPVKDLESIHRLLANKSTLMILVPNLSSWQARLFNRMWFSLRIQDHVHMFEKNTLANLVEGAEFEILNVTTPFSPMDIASFTSSLVPSMNPDRRDRPKGISSLIKVGLFALIGVVALFPSLLFSSLGAGETIKLIALKSDKGTDDE